MYYKKGRKVRKVKEGRRGIGIGAAGRNNLINIYFFYRGGKISIIKTKVKYKWLRFLSSFLLFYFFLSSKERRKFNILLI